MNEAKQVIVVRKDLNFGTKGKMIAQAGHAVMKVLLESCTHNEKYTYTWWTVIKVCFGIKSKIIDCEHILTYKLGSPWDLWLNGQFTKVCVYVNSEQELDEIYQKAKDAGIPAALIIDNGNTVFKGVKTKTCCAIGPGFIADIDKITGHLKLL
jgi:PTH2 family peptidyl-tRNA hydrolase